MNKKSLTRRRDVNEGIHSAGLYAEDTTNSTCTKINEACKIPDQIVTNNVQDCKPPENQNCR